MEKKYLISKERQNGKGGTGNSPRKLKKGGCRNGEIKEDRNSDPGIGGGNEVP